ncbi:hypothetical protein EMIT0111MI5_90044 [Burkholderia sp. IT-111MI5]
MRRLLGSRLFRPRPCRRESLRAVSSRRVAPLPRPCRAARRRLPFAHPRAVRRRAASPASSDAAWRGTDARRDTGAGPAGPACVRPVHAEHRRHPQGTHRSPRARAVRRRRADRRVPARQPRMGAAQADLAAHGRRADRDRGSPLLRASRHRLAPHDRGRAAYVLGRAPGRLDDHPAARAQPVPGRSRPLADAHAQGEGADHRVQDRDGVQQGRDPRNLPEYRAVPVQRVRRRNGRAHLLRQIGEPARHRRKRDARRDAEGQQLLQPGAESGTRGTAAQHRARPDGDDGHAVAAAAREIAAPAAARRLRAADGAARPRAALRGAASQVADRVGRPQQLRPLLGWPRRAYDARCAAAGHGDAGADAADRAAAGDRRQRMARPVRLRAAQRPVPRLHPPDTRLSQRPRRGARGCGGAEATRRKSRVHACAVRTQDAGAGRLRRDRSAQRCDQGMGRQSRFRQRAVRSRRAGAAPAGLDVQAVRLWRRVRGRHAAGRYVHRPPGRDSDRRPRGLAPDRRGAADGRADDAARRARAVAQSHHRAGDAAGRRREGRAARARNGRARQSARRGAVARARHEPRHAEGDGVRVRHDREPRRVRRAAGDHAHRGSRRQGARRIRQRAARTRVAGACRADARRRDARCRRSRHRRRHPFALRDSRGCRRQDRHDAGQHGRLVHPDASATGGRRMGRLRRRQRDASQRLLGCGRAQRAADRRQFLRCGAARACDRSACAVLARLPAAQRTGAGAEAAPASRPVRLAEAVPLSMPSAEHIHTTALSPPR